MDEASMAKGAFAAIGGAFAYVFGPWDTLLIVLLCFVILDYLTGFIGAAIRRELCSDVGFKGLFKKVMVFVLVGVASLLDKAMPDLHGALRAAVCLFYIANEGLSILENAEKIGLPLPAALTSVLHQMSKQNKKK